MDPMGAVAADPQVAHQKMLPSRVVDGLHRVRIMRLPDLPWFGSRHR
jgi:hypothetical protein